MLSPSDKQIIDTYRKHIAIIGLERVRLAIFCEWGQEGLDYLNGETDDKTHVTLSTRG